LCYNIFTGVILPHKRKSDPIKPDTLDPMKMFLVKVICATYLLFAFVPTLTKAANVTLTEPANQVPAKYTKVAYNQAVTIEMTRFQVQTDEPVVLKKVHAKVSTYHYSPPNEFIIPTAVFLYKEESLVGTVNVDGYYVDFDVNIQIQPGAPVQFSVHSGFSMKPGYGQTGLLVGSIEYGESDTEFVYAHPFPYEGGIQFISPHEGIVSAELTAPNGFDLLEETIKVKTVHGTEQPYTVYTLWYSDDLKNWTRVSAEHEFCKKVILEYSSDPSAPPFVSYYIKRFPTAQFFQVRRFIPSGFMFPRNLTLGMQGDDVANLQVFLEQEGYLYIPISVKRGYFGNTTSTALQNFQISKGITGETFFGPLTRLYINTNYQF
jgi:hypothetical protein